MILFWLAVVTALIWIVGGVEIVFGGSQIRYLRDVSAKGVGAHKVSVIVAARNEERRVREAMAGLAGQSGVDMEIVAVDDRSEDATGQLLDAMAARDSRFRIVHIRELPPGWMGKNNALHMGAAQSTGDWLLFMDGDVVMERHAIAKGLQYAVENRLDHVAVTPELKMRSVLTDLFGGVFVLLFSRYAKPWKVRDPRSRRFIGIGAFNLVRREAYDRVGGHSRIALRPDDDMALGKILKAGGFRQDVLYGTGELRVEWYPSIKEAIRGLEKNAFAGFDYSLWKMAGGCGTLLVFAVWPWLALMLTAGGTWVLNATSVAVISLLYLASSRSSGANPRYFPGIPIAILIFCYAVIRSTMLALVRGEVRWRGTAYRLSDLRRNTI